MPAIHVGGAGVKEQNVRRHDKQKESQEKNKLKKTPSHNNLEHKEPSPEASNKSNVEPNRIPSKMLILHRTESNIPLIEPVPCFDGASQNYLGTFKSALPLVNYAFEVMQCVGSFSFDNFTKNSLMGLRYTSDTPNFCFNPLQAIRAWGLLTTVAEGKTLRDIKSFVVNYGCSAIFPDDAYSVDTTLLALHSDIEEDIDGCVRLFTDLQKHLQPNLDILRNASVYYGGKSERNAIQHLCFATDSDGFYSCHRINEEMRLSTNGAIQYVVPERFAPNWRSSMALASSSDCTFYWKTLEKAKVIEGFLFKDDQGNKSRTSGYLALANVGVLKGQKVYQLQSHYNDFALFILTDFSKGALERLMEVRGQTVPIEKKTVLIPKCVTSLPISLFQHAKENGLSRIFSSEKSELTKLHDNLFENKANFITLWDHYHKTNFQIIPEPPTNTEKIHNVELLPSKAHMCIDEASSKLFMSAQKKPDYERALFTYYEDHLEKDRKLMEDPYTGGDIYTPPANVLAFNKTFHYVVVRYDTNWYPMAVCVGRFNNTPWVLTKESNGDIEKQ